MSTRSKRKSPYYHTVRSHVRQKRPVRQYERGKGDKPTQPTGRQRRRRERVLVGSRGPYSITISYIEDPSETLTLDALSYLAVINPALERRATLTGPWKMSIRRVG